MAQHPLSINGSTGRLALPVRFDVMTSIDMRFPFSRALADARVRTVAVDCAHLTYIDSMGIGTLIAWSRSCEEYGKSLVLDRCDGKIVSLLKLAGVAGLFVFEPLAA